MQAHRHANITMSKGHKWQLLRYIRHKHKIFLPKKETIFVSSNAWPCIDERSNSALHNAKWAWKVMPCKGTDTICQGTDIICQGTNMITCSPYLEKTQHISQVIALCIFHGAATIIVLDVWVSSPLQQQLHRFHLHSKQQSQRAGESPDYTV